MPARLKLNYFTPLPPERTAIAEFSIDVLSALAEVADVTVWTYQSEWMPIEGVEVRRFDADTDPAKFHAAAMTFFNVGNNFAYHAEIYATLRRIPGTVILHDPNLQYFFYSMAKASAAGRRHYLSVMARHYGATGVVVANRLFANRTRVEEVLRDYLMTNAALDNALAVVTHNRAVRGELERGTGLPSFYLPLAYDSRRRETTPKVAHAPPYRVISFGYMGPNRRHDAVSRALASLEQRGRFTWDLYGSFDPKSIPRRQRRRLGSALTEHGFVDNDTLNRAVANADLAINLRNPTMGESSSTQLKIWHHGLPSLVSRIGWYADQPADTLFFVEPGREFEDVTRHLQAFLADPAPFYEAGRRGQAYVDRVHGPRQYAQGLVEIAREAAAIRRRRGAMDLARRAAHHLLTLVPPEAVAAMSPRLAHHIDGLLGVCDGSHHNSITNDPAPAASRNGAGGT